MRITKKTFINMFLIMALTITGAFTACGGKVESSKDKIEDEKAIYIDSINGYDKNSGKTPKDAKKTLYSLMPMEMQPGTTIYLKGSFKGTLSFSGSGTKEAPITITSYGEDKAIIDGDGASSCIVLSNQSNIIIDNLEITLTAEEMTARNAIFITGSEGIVSNITVKNCYLHDIVGTIWGVNATGSYWNSYYTSCAISVLYNKPIPDKDNTFENINIRDCKIENIYGCGIHVHNTNPYADDRGLHPFFKNVIIENTEIDTTSADGIILQGCDSPIVRGCKVFHVGKLGHEASENFHCAVWACGTSSPLFEYNEIAYTNYINGDGQAFDMDWSCSGTSVWQYNYTHDNEGGVMLRHMDYRGIYRYNISINDGSKKLGRGLIFHSNPFNMNVKEKLVLHNNVFYNDEIDLKISYAYVNYPNVETYDSSFNYFKNNIFVSRNIVNWGQNATFDGNCYFNLENKNDFAIQDEHAVKGNPLFAIPYKKPTSRKEAGEVFELDLNSPCRNSGIALDKDELYNLEGKNFNGDETTNNIGAI